jgi:phage repressor protein C with HTH and peptisase S24 domain
MDDRRGDGIFFITMFGETRIKRLYYRLVDRTILIASENQKRYPDPEKVSVEMMETGQLIVQGRVFALFRKMVM